MRDDRDREAVVERVDDGEADPVDGDRALLDDVAQQVAVAAHAQVGRRVDDLADAVDVTLHEVAAEAVGQPHRPFEVDRVAGGEVAEAGAAPRLVGQSASHQSGRPSATTVRQQPLTAIDAPSSTSSSTRRAADPQAIAVALGDAAQLLDDPGEHRAPTVLAAVAVPSESGVRAALAYLAMGVPSHR